MLGAANGMDDLVGEFGLAYYCLSLADEIVRNLLPVIRYAYKEMENRILLGEEKNAILKY